VGRWSVVCARLVRRIAPLEQLGSKRAGVEEHSRPPVEVVDMRWLETKWSVSQAVNLVGSCV